MDLTTQVQTDLDNAKTSRCVEIEMIDGKISAEFCVKTEIDPYSMPNEVCYDKVFDNWKEFNDYADSFFKL